MSENSNNLQAASQVFDRIFQVAEDLRAEAVAGDPNDKKIVGPSLKISSIGTRASEHPSAGRSTGMSADDTMPKRLNHKRSPTRQDPALLQLAISARRGAENTHQASRRNGVAFEVLAGSIARGLDGS
jgi:hypothetical protein